MEHLSTLLAETAAWCRQSEPVHGWRTPELEPLVFAEGSFNYFASETNSEVLARRQATVARLAAQRSHLLRTRGILIEDSLYASLPLLTKYLLRCTADTESVWDGASEAESEGFFDTYDLPPWDTWLCYVIENEKRSTPMGSPSPRGYLLSWVPPKMKVLVSQGMEVNITDCIRWFHETL